MPTSIEIYNSHQIILTEYRNGDSPVISINDRVIAYTRLESGRYHSEYIPYQNFEDLTDLAKYVIDYLPNVVME